MSNDIYVKKSDAAIVAAIVGLATGICLIIIAESEYIKAGAFLFSSKLQSSQPLP